MICAALAALVALSGCDAPTRPARRSQTDAVQITGRVEADGTTRLQATVQVRQAGKGKLALAAPPLGDVSDISIDGTRQAGLYGGATTTDVQVEGTVGWTVTGTVERHPDVSLYTLPVWAGDPAGRISDPAVRIDIDLAVPKEPAPTHARWDGVIDGSTPVITPTGVHLHGLVSPTEPSQVVLTFDPSAFAPVTAAPTPGASRLDSDDARAVRANRRIASAYKNEHDKQDLIAVIYWAAVGIEVALPLLIAATRLWRAAAARRRSEHDVREQSEPPADGLDPALIALLHGEGKQLGAAAVAGTILDLAVRKAIAIDGITSEQYAIEIKGDGKTAGEQAILSALIDATDERDRVTGPPLPMRHDGSWWQAYERDTVSRAKAAGLLQRRYPSGVFITSVIALAATTAPLWARSPMLAAGGWAVAGVLCLLPFVGGLTLSPAGHQSRARWLAYGRFLHHGTELSDVGAPGVIVRGRALADAAALGIATEVIKDLTPRGAASPSKGTAPTKGGVR